MGRPAKWQSTRKRVAFAPTTMTTTTIEPDDTPVLLPESARAGEQRRLKPSPLVARARQQLKYRSRARSYRVQRHRMLRCACGRRSSRVSRNPSGSDLRVCGLQRGKCEGEERTAAWIVRDTDTAAMRSHDFADDGEAEAGAFLLFARAAPEPFENVLPILSRDAAAAIGHLDPAGTIDRRGQIGRASWK